jgi:hypothetical protein
MGSQQSIPLASYEEIIKYRSSSILINTLPPTQQLCLIQGTVPADQEETTLNALIDSCQFSQRVIIYGRNCTDRTPYRKLEQLLKLGFSRVAIYPGGILEWLLLQDAYGKKGFGTTGTVEDILRFGPMHN